MKLKLGMLTLTSGSILTVLILGIVFNPSIFDSQASLRELTFTQMSAITGGACRLPEEAQPSDKWQPEENCYWRPLYEGQNIDCGQDGIWWNEDWACNGASYQSSSECIEVDAGVVEYVYH